MTTNNSEKTLIVFDTNKLYETLTGESDYSIFDPRGDIKKLKDFISKNNLKEHILIGLSEIVLREYCNHRRESFDQQLDQFKQIYSKIKNLDVCKNENLKLPEGSFDYSNYISEKLNQVVLDTQNGFILIPLEKEKYNEIFEKILNKAINHKKPFKERGDRGFKDAIIFESLIEFQKKNNFAKVILFTKNLDDFPEELVNEFSSLTGKLLDIESNYELLEQTLEDTYRIIIKYSELLNHFKTDYFKGQLMDFMADFLSLGINNFNITNSCSGIDDCSVNDLKEFGLEEYLEEIIDNFKKVSLEFENDGKNYESKIIFDLSINEIIGGDYKEKEATQII